ncbi:MAG TPA: GspH/FimT family pseudopilin [Gemmatimonadaceae bacterium]|nr:GspH/FimT family pseudopilin [Gemmatimonadaceae bacterium]
MVLLLLGVTAALVAPAVTTLRRSRGDDVSRATEAVVDLLARARKTALDRAQTIDVIVDPAGSHAWIVAREAGELHMLESSSLPVDANATLVAVTPRVRFTFAPSGIASGGPLSVLGSRESRAITVDPWSGEIHVSAR